MTDAPESATVLTFGCRLNAYESRVIAGHTAGLGDTVIVNTCAVTAEAERQARQAVRRVRRQRPDARIVVTGCAAQIDPGAWAAMPEVDRVVGNIEKLDPAAFLPASDAPVQVNDIMAVRETASHLVGGFDGKARAYVQVQNGCDHRCTFCIIPYGRGNNRSAALGPIVEQVRTLVANGYREIVLTGVDITAYGADLPGAPTLGQMVEAAARGRAGAGAPAPDLAGLRRGRRHPVPPDRRGAAADAASASQPAGRRRPDPQAHEAAAQPAAGDRLVPAGPGGAPRYRLRRRPDRRVPDRNRGNVPTVAGT